MTTTTIMHYVLTKGRFSYDSTVDALFVRIPGEYRGTVVQGLFHIDLSKKGDIIAVEILDASKVLKIPKNVLEHHEHWECKVVAHKESIAVEFTFRTERSSVEARLEDVARKPYPETRLAVTA